jgi:GTP-binding protein
LRRVFLLIDPIRGMKETDHEAINVFNTLAVSFQIILTKSDKLSIEELKKVESGIYEEMKKWPAAFPCILATSSSKGYGIFELQNEITKILELI